MDDARRVRGAQGAAVPGGSRGCLRPAAEGPQGAVGGGTSRGVVTIEGPAGGRQGDGRGDP